MTQNFKQNRYLVTLEFVRHKRLRYELKARNLFQAASRALYLYEEDGTVKAPRVKPINIHVEREPLTGRDQGVVVNFRWKASGQLILNRFRYRARMPNIK